MIFPDFTSTEVKLAGLYFAGFSFLPFLKIGTMFSSFQSARTSLDSQACSKIIKTGFAMTQQLLEDSWMNPNRPHRFVGIQMEQQILHMFRVNGELIILAFMVLQLKTLGPFWSVNRGEDKGKECKKDLCLVSVPGSFNSN